MVLFVLSRMVGTMYLLRTEYSHSLFNLSKKKCGTVKFPLPKYRNAISTPHRNIETSTRYLKDRVDCGRKR